MNKSTGGTLLATINGIRFGTPTLLYRTPALTGGTLRTPDLTLRLEPVSPAYSSTPTAWGAQLKAHAIVRRGLISTASADAQESTARSRHDNNLTLLYHGPSGQVVLLESHLDRTNNDQSNQLLVANSDYAPVEHFEGNIDTHAIPTGPATTLDIGAEQQRREQWVRSWLKDAELIVITFSEDRHVNRTLELTVPPLTDARS